jgi:hypothetical protein
MKLNNTAQRTFLTLILALPWLGLLVAAVQWLRFGLDMPLGDDWNTYINGTMRSFKLNYLFAHGNDTLYPVGKVLDSLAYRLLNGNTIAYQLLSMLFVLGSLLILQWKLLVFGLKDQWLAAAAFSLTLLMVQPDTYWGWQNLAFHQALPLVVCMASLYVVLITTWQKASVFTSCLVMGLLGGFSYISGAFATLTLGLVFLALFYAQRTANILGRRMLWGGTGLFISGVISTAAQTWVITHVQKGTHIPGLRMALPTELDFWLFMLGKIARSLMLPKDHPVVSLLITLVFVALIVFFSFVALRTVLAKQPVGTETQQHISIIFMALASVIFVYLALVCAGRTHMRPAEDTAALKVFGWGFHRFHFFWVTLLWPWLAAMVMVHVKSRKPGHVKTALVWVIPALVLPWAIYAGAFKHAGFFKYTLDIRAGGLHCLQTAMRDGTEVNCWQLLPEPLRQGIVNGQQTGASFTNLITPHPLPK